MHRSPWKIAKQHTVRSPGWSAPPEVTPEEWIEQTIKPLLAGKPFTIEKVRDYSGIRGGTAEQPHKPIQAVCDIEIAPRIDYSYRGSRVACLLYWVGDERHVALSQGQLSRGYVGADPSKDLLYLADPAAMVRLVSAMHDQVQQDAFQKQKQEKIKSLKRQAVMAQLRQIAAEERFAFYVETTTLLIRVGVRLDENQHLVISIPFSEFESILPLVREAVISLRTLHQHKIRFKTTQTHHRQSWIMPDPAPST